VTRGSRPERRVTLPLENDPGGRLRRAAGLDQPPHLAQIDAGYGERVRELSVEPEPDELFEAPRPYDSLEILPFPVTID